MTNPNTHRDATEPLEEGENGTHINMTKRSTEELVSAAEKMHALLMHDESVTNEDIANLQNALNSREKSVLELELESLSDKDKEVTLAILGGNTNDIGELATVGLYVAKELAGVRENELYLSGLRNIGKEVANEIAGFRGNGLYLNGLRNIGKEAARELAGFRGSGVWLNGLTEISEGAAKELAGFKEYLSLKPKIQKQVDAYRSNKS